MRYTPVGLSHQADLAEIQRLEDREDQLQRDLNEATRRASEMEGRYDRLTVSIGRKGWGDYLSEALGLGLVAGCLALVLALIFGDPSRTGGLLIMGLAFGVFAGLRLMVGRDLSATQKPERGEP